MRHRLNRLAPIVGLESRLVPSTTLSLVSKADPAFIVDSAGGASMFGVTGFAHPPVSQLQSADGRFTVYVSNATNLVSGQVDTNAGKDVFLYDRSLNTTTLVSHSIGSLSSAGNNVSDAPSISADGQFIAYVSQATNLVTGFADGNSNEPDGTDVFLYDCTTGLNSLVSHTPGSITTSGDRLSRGVILNANGRYLAFDSEASNLVTGYSPNVGSTNNSEVYLCDRVTGALNIVSHAYSGSLSPADTMSSYSGAISDDGEFISFESFARNLVAPISSKIQGANAYVYQQSTGLNTLLSHAPGQPLVSGNNAGDPLGFCRLISTSADGRYVTFNTYMTNLVSGFADGNGGSGLDIYMADRLTDSIILINHNSSSSTTSSNAEALFPTVSTDGRFVLYQSAASDLVAGFTSHGGSSLYLFDRLTGLNTLVTHGAIATEGANGPAASLAGSMTADGSKVVFSTRSTNLVPGFVDGNGSKNADVFLFDRATGAISLVSHLSGSQIASGDLDSSYPVISANGQTIAFSSAASNFVSNDSNQQTDTFVTDASASSLALITRHAPGDVSATPNGDSPGYFEAGGSRSVDGRYVIYVSSAANIDSGVTDTNGKTDIFLYDRVTATNTLISHSALSNSIAADSASVNGVISGDGRYIAFNSFATDIVPNFVDANGADQSDNYLYDRITGTTILLSHSVGTSATSGNQASGNPPTNFYDMAISFDGQYVAYTSYATDLIAGFVDNNSFWNDLYLYDRLTDTSQLISHSAADPSTGVNRLVIGYPSMSDDGRYVVFSDHSDNLLIGVAPYGDSRQAFLYDRVTNAISLVSHAATGTSDPSNGGSFPASISADGNYVTFTSSSNNIMADGAQLNTNNDVFLYNRVTGINVLVSHAAGSMNDTGTFPSANSSVSTDGRFVAYSSSARNLIPGFVDHNDPSVSQGITGNDVYLYGRLTGLNTLISHSVASLIDGGNGWSANVQISGDGRFVVFNGSASDLVAGVIAPIAGQVNTFIFDRLTGVTRIMSYSEATNQTGNGMSQRVAISRDGTSVYFDSLADNLIASDFNSFTDFFAYVTPPPQVASIQINDGSPQRSIIRSITVNVDEPVFFNGDPASAFTLTRVCSVGSVQLAVGNVSNNPNGSITLTFSGALTQFGSLIDGKYSLSIDASKVSNIATLDGNGDGVAGDNWVSSAGAILRVFGDADGNGIVDGIDFGAFRGAFNTNSVVFDLDGNGIVDGLEFGRFRQNFGAMI